MVAFIKVMSTGGSQVLQPTNGRETWLDKKKYIHGWIVTDTYDDNNNDDRELA